MAQGHEGVEPHVHPLTIYRGTEQSPYKRINVTGTNMAPFPPKQKRQ